MDSDRCPVRKGSVCYDAGQPRSRLHAVWLRYTRLRSLPRQDLLAEWQHSNDFDQAVFHVAATIPINGYELDEESFVQRLRYESAA